MSMGAILEQVRDHLKTMLSLAPDQIGIRLGGLPPECAKEFYLAIDELEVKSSARNHLKETYEIEVSVWRRMARFSQDRHGEMYLRDDPYLAGILTLDDLERAVIRNLHANYTNIMAATNTAIGAGSADNGDVFQLTLYYSGRKKTESLPAGNRSGSPKWLGRRMKFSGMTRAQATDQMQ